MTAQELQSQVKDLAPDELKRFEEWFENYMADLWDEQIESDAKAGKLDNLFGRTRENIALGKFSEI